MGPLLPGLPDLPRLHQIGSAAGCRSCAPEDGSQAWPPFRDGEASFVIGLGSNRRHGRHGSPARVLRAALDALAGEGVRIAAASAVASTPPLGPGGRRYANAAAIIVTHLDPPALLSLLQQVERDFGRRRGRRWGARVLDLDILLWSGGRWSSRTLEVPHRELARRRFVLDPLLAIASDWRLPGGPTVRQIHARLARPRVDPSAPAP